MREQQVETRFLCATVAGSHGNSFSTVLAAAIVGSVSGVSLLDCPTVLVGQQGCRQKRHGLHAVVEIEKGQNGSAIL